ncbi:bifunctional glycosyltransferase family 2/GtrA family protein [Frankia sp. EUN1f]|uniref:bifunctional glycosyltransferase family 2/GtrA family protein n=1 Tax=Parafrankia sp. EUN1f TaxID=102897 RepID=UPI0001C468BE|nr:glycosyl transferase family 2 [Parafrankia sp. EUN1f]
MMLDDVESRPLSGVASGHAAVGANMTGPDVEIVIPVYNEENDLGPSVRRLHAFLGQAFPFSTVITIADNASTDGTWACASRLAQELTDVRAVHLDQKGRGRALRQVWLASTARVVAYMDVDLSTDLGGLLPLVAPLISGHSDLAIGSRLARGSRVVRGPKREVISRCYNLLLRTTLRASFSDAQCGFKAMRTEAAHRLLPLVLDTAWFFDTELLVLAERCGLRIHEVPVDWVDDPDSRVDIVATALADLRGVARVGRALATGRLPVGQLRAQLGRAPLTSDLPEVPPRLVRQLVRFVAIGVASTVTYLIVFVLLRGWLGPQVANLFALLLTAVANTAANRRLTFGVRGVGARSHVEGLVIFAVGLALTSGALAGLHALADEPGRGVELAVLVIANLVVTVLRFVAFRAWVFHPRRDGAPEKFVSSSGPAVVPAPSPPTSPRTPPAATAVQPQPQSRPPAQSQARPQNPEKDR